MSKHSMTTQQLAERCIRDIKKMSPEEKKNVRRHLTRAFGKAKLHDDDTEHNHILDYMLKNGIELTLENYLDISFLGNPPEGITEDGEFLASVPEVILYGPRLVQ